MKNINPVNKIDPATTNVGRGERPNPLVDQQTATVAEPPELSDANPPVESAPTQPQPAQLPQSQSASPFDTSKIYPSAEPKQTATVNITSPYSDDGRRDPITAYLISLSCLIGGIFFTYNAIKFTISTVTAISLSTGGIAGGFFDLAWPTTVVFFVIGAVQLVLAYAVFRRYKTGLAIYSGAFGLYLLISFPIYYYSFSYSGFRGWSSGEIATFLFMLLTTAALLYAWTKERKAYV